MTDPDRAPVTADQLAAACGVSAGTIRHHCRPGGLLAGQAYKAGRDWLIPWPAAEDFARTYEKHGTLRKTRPAP